MIRRNVSKSAAIKKQCDECLAGKAGRRAPQANSSFHHPYTFIDDGLPLLSLVTDRYEAAYWVSPRLDTTLLVLS
jgi:hypothetical protein